MNKTNKIIFVSTILITLIVIGINFICKVSVKCKNCPEVSITKEESIKRNLYITTYYPVQSRYNLKYSTDSVEFTELWVENAWFINSDICLFKRVEKSKGYNAKILFNKSSDDYVFNLEGFGRGRGMGKSSKTILFYGLRLPDSLEFNIVEKNEITNKVKFKRN